MDSEDLCCVNHQQERERCDVSPLLLGCLCLTKCSQEASHLSAEVACTTPSPVFTLHTATPAHSCEPCLRSPTMKAIKKMSAAAKAAGRLRVEDGEETASMISGQEEEEEEWEYDGEVTKNWEKISKERR